MNEFINKFSMEDLTKIEDDRLQKAYNHFIDTYGIKTFKELKGYIDWEEYICNI